MIIPNEPMSGLEKFKLNPTSPSTLNDFSKNPCKLILRKLFGYEFESSCAIERGNATEEHLPAYMEGLITVEETVQKALQTFKQKCHPDWKDYDKELATIPCLVRGACEELKDYKLLNYQEKVKGNIDGYECHGFTDFVLKKKDSDEKFIVDLKTTGRTPSNLNTAHARQISIYSKIMNCDAQLLYLIPHKKTDRKTKEVTYTSNAIWVEIEDKQKFLDSAVAILRAMDMLLYNCNDKFEVAKMFYPDVDDWTWNTPTLIEARKKVWGL